MIGSAQVISRSDSDMLRLEAIIEARHLRSDVQAEMALRVMREWHTATDGSTQRYAAIRDADGRKAKRQYPYA